MKSYASALNEEYRFRYNHSWNHKAFDVIESLPLPQLHADEPDEDSLINSIPLCMPEGVQVQGNTIESYRNYYIKHKSHLAKWKSRDVPEWYK